MEPLTIIAPQRLPDRSPEAPPGYFGGRDLGAFAGFAAAAAAFCSTRNRVIAVMSATGTG